MDPVTHLAAGGIQGTALKPLVAAKHLLLFCVLASWLPDIDNLAGFFGPEFYLVHHRGVTHSFIGALVLAALFAALFRLWDRTLPLVTGSLVAYAGIVNHIFLDLITSYGTQIFAPLSRGRFSVQCVFIIDPVFTLSLVLVLILIRMKPRHQTRIACLGLVWLAVYPALNLGLRLGLEAHLRERLRLRGEAFATLELTTEALTPLNWKLIVDTGDRFRMAAVSLLQPNGPLRFEEFTKADRALLESLGGRVEFFRTYAWFAMYPVMAVAPTTEGSRVTFHDLRFRSTLPWVRNLFRNRDGPFSLTADFDRRGDLTAYTYQQTRAVRVVQHLE